MKLQKPVKTLIKLIASLAGFALTASALNAQTIVNMNFTRLTPTEATVTNPGYGLWGQGTETWNLSDSDTGSNLVDSSGTATTVGYSFGNKSGDNSNTGFGPDDLTFQGAYGQDITVTISGLTPSASYELLIYHAANNENEVETANGVSPNDFTGSTTTTGGTTYLDAFGVTDADGTHFWYYTSVDADVAGEILVATTGDGFETATGFQITDAVPEPSSFALIAGCFGLALVMLRRRS